MKKLILLLGLLSLISLLGACTSTFPGSQQEEPPSNENMMTFEKMGCEAAGGTCIGVENLDTWPENTMLARAYTCEGKGLCAYPSELPYDDKEAYNLLYGMLFIGSSYGPPEQFGDNDDDWVFVTEDAEYRINKNAGVLYCGTPQGLSLNCYKSHVAIIGSLMIMDTVDGYNCMGECPQEVIDEFERRKALLPSPEPVLFRPNSCQIGQNFNCEKFALEKEYVNMSLKYVGPKERIYLHRFHYRLPDELGFTQCTALIDTVVARNDEVAITCTFTEPLGVGQLNGNREMNTVQIEITYNEGSVLNENPIQAVYGEITEQTN